MRLDFFIAAQTAQIAQSIHIPWAEQLGQSGQQKRNTTAKEIKEYFSPY